MAPTHGPLFDEFHAQAGNPHGPESDQGYGASATANAGGSLDSLTPTYRQNTADPIWDDRSWHTPMHSHGRLLDEGFDQPAALDGSTHDHGTWFDVFRGGRPIKAIVDGKDVEAVVIECHDGHVVAEVRRGKNQGGGRVELALSQITGLAAATDRATFGQTRRVTAGDTKPTGHGMKGVADGQGTVHTTIGGHSENGPIPASTAHAPSARSATASGGHLRKSLDETLVDLRKIAES